MTDDNDNNDVKFPYLTPLHDDSNRNKAYEKMDNIRQLKQLTPDSKWTIVQDIAQELQADYISRGLGIPTSKQLLKDIVEKIEKDYDDEPEKKVIILKAIPSIISLGKWYKNEGWNKAVWEKVKNDTLFSKERRSAMINALYERGLQKDTNAAKMYLTMSGDFSDRPPDEKNGVADTFREINKILHKKA